jgi:antitoxin component of MazEF toxin-antitoxin module
MRRKLEDKNVRKIFKSGDSYAVTLPMEVIDKLGWREKQKVVVKGWGKRVVIKDWEK